MEHFSQYESYDETFKSKDNRAEKTLQNLIIDAKMNEINKAKTQKLYQQLFVENNTLDKAINQSLVVLAQLQRDIRHIQQNNVLIKNKLLVNDSVQETNRERVLPTEMQKVGEMEQLLKDFQLKLKEICVMDCDFKLKPYGKTLCDQLNAMHSQVMGITDEYVIVAGKEEQLLICSEIKQQSDERANMLRKIEVLKKEKNDIQKQVDKVQLVIHAIDKKQK
uniref:Uncharacterized protein n=1 Tax=Trepomonas sp. PC1 TaxID=1076344 RepID=A0A146KCB6_9EUKA|eukprot:JAP93315.1 Hypothetical protein TPC1_14453 [Trepomonas sp. PC1]